MRKAAKTSAYTTTIVLPDEEEILDVACGDKQPESGHGERSGVLLSSE
jgi:type IV secretory pathway VirB9-like protein